MNKLYPNSSNNNLKKPIPIKYKNKDSTFSTSMVMPSNKDYDFLKLANDYLQRLEKKK